MNRIHGLAIILFFFFLTHVVSAHDDSFYTPDGLGDTFYVDSSDLSLQQILNTVPEGSTVYLSAGVYSEQLLITKPLKIIGEDAEQTILRVCSPKNSFAVHITASGVTLEHITIINTGPGIYTTGVKVTASSTHITSCHFQDTPIGIALWSSDNTIDSCAFSNCDDEGIVLLGTTLNSCENNIINNCVFSNNCDGIELQNAVETAIKDCTFQDNSHAGIDAIGMKNSQILVSTCIFSDNQAFDLYDASQTAVQLDSCSFGKQEPSGSTERIRAFQEIIQEIRNQQAFRPLFYRVYSILERFNA